MFGEGREERVYLIDLEEGARTNQQGILQALRAGETVGHPAHDPKLGRKVHVDLAGEVLAHARVREREKVDIRAEVSRIAVVAS